MRKKIYGIHLYSALITGLILIVIAVTGCLLVFELRMDRWLDAAVSYVEPAGNPVPFATIMQQLNAAYPGQRVTELNVGEPGISVMARIGGLRVFVNPYNGKIIASRTGEPASFHLRHLHRELAGGKIGATIVNLTTFLLLLQSLSGLYLWWPLKRTVVKLSASARKITLDLHHVVGFFSSVFICILAITGLVKGYGDVLQPYFDSVTGSPRMTRDVPSRPLASTISIDDAIATGRAQLPGATLARILPPKTKNGSWVIEMKFRGDSTVPGRSWVVVDQYSGAVVSRLDSRTAPIGSKIPIVNREIHVGGIFGAPTRILAFLVGFAVLVQAITGYMMWWRKRAARTQAENKVRDFARVTS